MARIIATIALLAVVSVVRAVEPAGAPPRTAIMVLPFHMLGDEMKNQWIGQAIAQNLQAELAQQPSIVLVGNITVTPPVRGPVAEPPAIDDKALIQLGRKAGANLLVVGSYQVVSTEVRVTGRILDLATGQPIGFLKATASQRQLFELEDMLADQARQILGLPGPNEGKVAAADQPKFDDQIAWEAAPQPLAPLEATEPPLRPELPVSIVDTYLPAYTYYYPTYITAGYYYAGCVYPYRYRYSCWGWPYLYSSTYYPSYVGSSWFSFGFYYGRDRSHDRRYDGRRDNDHRPGRDDHDRPRGRVDGDGPRKAPPVIDGPGRRNTDVIRAGNDNTTKGLGPRREIPDSRTSAINVKPARAVESSRAAENRRETSAPNRSASDTGRSSRTEQPFSPAPKTQRQTPGPVAAPAQIERPITRTPSSPPASRVESPSNPATSRAERPSSSPPKMERPSSPPASRVERPSSPPTSRAERPSSPPPRMERPSSPPASRVERPSSPPPRFEQPSAPARSNGNASRSDAGASSPGRSRR